MLDDAVLHVVQAFVVGVENRAGRRDVGAVLRVRVPRQFQHGVEPGADPARFGALVAAAFELPDLTHRGLSNLLGQLGLLDPCSVVLRTVGLVLAEFLADRGKLLAQQELALRLLHAFADLVADPAADLEFGKLCTRPLRKLFEPDVDICGLK